MDYFLALMDLIFSPVRINGVCWFLPIIIRSFEAIAKLNKIARENTKITWADLKKAITHLKLENNFIWNCNYSIFVSTEISCYKLSCLWFISKIHCCRLWLRVIQLLSSFPMVQFDPKLPACFSALQKTVNHLWTIHCHPVVWKQLLNK